jgi:hypothetical protein
MDYSDDVEDDQEVAGKSRFAVGYSQTLVIA